MCCKTTIYLPGEDGLSGEDGDRIRAMLLSIGCEDKGYRYVLELPAPEPRHEFDVPTPRRVTVRFDDNAIHFDIQPFIYGHTIEDHAVAALAGSIVFKLADMIGQHVGGRVMQEYLLGVCLEENSGKKSLLLADYAKGHRMEYPHVCVGFQHAFAKGVPLVEGQRFGA